MEEMLEELISPMVDGRTSGMYAKSGSRSLHQRRLRERFLNMWAWRIVISSLRGGEHLVGTRSSSLERCSVRFLVSSIL